MLIVVVCFSEARVFTQMANNPQYSGLQVVCKESYIEVSCRPHIYRDKILCSYISQGVFCFILIFLTDLGFLVVI